MNAGEPQILVGVFRDVAWVRVRGKGTFRISPALRRFANCIVEEEGQDRIIVDLEECPAMDSTFMGTLTGIALMLKERPASMFQVINAGEKNLDSLRTLGLDQVFHVDVDGLSWRHERALVEENVSRPLEHAHLSPAEKRRFIVEAHQALCDANRENVSEFQDVLQFLSEHPRG
jgi:anti-anti-sigma regulatory factor